MARPISIKLVEDTARELMARAAIDIPADYREGVRQARDREQNRIATARYRAKKRAENAS